MLNDFEYHIHLEHSVWDYIYFIAYLQFKDANSGGLTFEEKYVLDSLNRNDLSWFP